MTYFLLVMGCVEVKNDHKWQALSVFDGCGLLKCEGIVEGLFDL